VSLRPDLEHIPIKSTHQKKQSTQLAVDRNGGCFSEKIVLSRVSPEGRFAPLTARFSLKL
jgi:hypothetical protein